MILKNARLALKAPHPHAVILNGVSPWAQAGAKRSEEPSLRDSAWAKAGAILTETGGGGGDGRERVPTRRLRPFTFSDSSLRFGRKASRNCVQNDGWVWGAKRASCAP